MLGLANLLDADRHGCRAAGNAVGLGAADDAVPGAIERLLEAAHHFVLSPEILLQVLHPFKVTDDHAARIAQYVRNYENLRVALPQYQIGVRRRRPVGAFGEDPAL